MIPLLKSNPMKLKVLILLLGSFLYTSCSDSTDDSNEEPINDANYFPLVANNTWDYDNIQEVNGQEAQQSMDVMTVSGMTTINGLNYFNFDQEELQEGFATGLFSNGAVRKPNNELLYTGNLEFAFEGMDALEIPIIDAVVYNKVAANGTALFSAENSITQTIMDIPIIIDFVVTTTDAGDFSSYTAGLETYEDVIAANITVNITVTAQVELLGDILSIPILRAQDVITSTNYYAANVGLIFSDVSLQYQAEDLSQLGVVLPFPESASGTSSQTLTSFQVTLD